MNWLDARTASPATRAIGALMVTRSSDPLVVAESAAQASASAPASSGDTAAGASATPPASSASPTPPQYGANQARKRTYLSDDDVVLIFKAKDSVSTELPALAETSTTLSIKFNLTTKAIRDIWNTRTWAGATAPYWSPADRHAWLRKRVCPACISCVRVDDLASPTSACTKCQLKVAELLRMCGNPAGNHGASNAAGAAAPQSSM
jgi:hypothetical protein